MGKVSKEQLKQWFAKGQYPTGEQFAGLIDSFHHKGSVDIPISDVEGLRDELNSLTNMGLTPLFKIGATPGSSSTYHHWSEAFTYSKFAIDNNIIDKGQLLIDDNGKWSVLTVRNEEFRKPMLFAAYEYRWYPKRASEYKFLGLYIKPANSNRIKEIALYENIVSYLLDSGYMFAGYNEYDLLSYRFHSIHPCASLFFLYAQAEARQITWYYTETETEEIDIPAGVSIVTFGSAYDSESGDYRYLLEDVIPLDIALKSETDTKMAAMKSEITSLGERANCEVRIVYHSITASNWIRMVRPEMWNDTQYWTKDGNACTAEESGQIADGVMISDGAHTLIVAPTHAEPMKWSSVNKAVEGGYQYIEDAVSDWNGKQHTAALLADADISAEGTENAVGWCNAYERLNAQGKGFTAGSWWLPSMGELMFIMMHQKQLDYALSQIGGADLIDPDNKGYWSSTEVGVPSGQAKLPQYSLDLMHQCAWYLGCKFGAPEWYYRNSLSRVRAVTALTEGNYYNS